MGPVVFVLGFITVLQGAMSKCDLVAGLGFLMLIEGPVLVGCKEMPFWGRLISFLVAVPALAMVVHKAGVLDTRYLGQIGEYPIVAAEAVLLGCLHLVALLSNRKKQGKTAPVQV